MKNGVCYLIVLVSVIISPLLGCASNQPISPLPTVTKAAETAITRTWQDDWNNVVNAAKKEGEVSIYWEGMPEVKRRITNEFKQRYGIDLVILSAAGSEIGERMSRERSAGISNVDVVLAGHFAILTLLKPKGLIGPMDELMVLPEVKDSSQWFAGKFPWVDAEHFLIKFGGTINTGIWRNTEMVSNTQIQAYADLLKPAWKGKIIFQDPTIPGAASAWFRLYYSVLGEDYMKALIKQEPTVLRDKRLQAEWLARGSYPILLCGNPETLFDFKKSGAKVEFVETKEGEYVVVGPGSLAISSNLVHPNATKVFLNWFLNKEGQTAWSQETLFQSYRIDAPTSHLDPVTVQKPGKIYVSDTLETWAQSEKLMELSKQIFAPLIPK